MCFNITIITSNLVTLEACCSILLNCALYKVLSFFSFSVKTFGWSWTLHRRKNRMSSLLSFLYPIAIDFLTLGPNCFCASFRRIQNAFNHNITYTFLSVYIIAKFCRLLCLSWSRECHESLFGRNHGCKYQQSSNFKSWLCWKNIEYLEYSCQKWICGCYCCRQRT